MAIQCIFSLEGLQQPCQVLRTAGAPQLPARTCERLQRTFCRSGAFINCPVFARVERGLVAMRRLSQLEQEPLPGQIRRGARAAQVA